MSNDNVKAFANTVEHPDFIFLFSFSFIFIYDVNKLSYKALLPVVQLAPLLDELALFCRKSHLIIHI